LTTKHQAWATKTFGLSVAHTRGTTSVEDLILLGLRRNPRRAHLLVSTVLGKHIAVAPDTVTGAGQRLASVIAGRIDGDVDVLGMAETATGLGHCVADALDAAMYLHTTRRPAERSRIFARFQEGHSHATDHTLQPSAVELLSQPRTLVIVDDEISTGTTALAAIEALHAVTPRPHYVVASLVDVRAPHHLDVVACTARRLNTAITFVSLATGEVVLPPGLVDAVCALDAPELNRDTGLPRGTYRSIPLRWPGDTPDGGRHGVLQTDHPRFNAATEAAAAQLAAHLDPTRPTLVVGHEELMYLPLRVAEHLQHSGFSVRFQSTTRSPAYVYEHPGYPLQTGYRFDPCEPGETAHRYLYNGWLSVPGGSTQLVLVLDETAAEGALDAEESIVDVLTAAGYDVLVAVVAGPDADTLAGQRRNIR
jgi:orotate phosphoribosyltransferase-like protein